jgi:hypothetical protein
MSMQVNELDCFFSAPSRMMKVTDTAGNIVK